MHELGIAETIMDRVEVIRIENGAPGVTSVQLQVGDLSGVDTYALEMAFTIATERTSLADTRWDIERVPARVTCRACGETTAPEGPFPICLSCDSTDIEIVAGRELMINTIEVAGDPE